MANKTLALNLGKLIIAAAWADGRVDSHEVNVLKRLLLEVPQVTTEDWRRLELYLDHAVTERELQGLLRNVVDGISTRADKTLVLSTLRSLIEADGVVTAEEAALYATVEAAVDAKTTGLVGALGRLVGKAARSMSGREPMALREERLEDFINNPLYFRLAHPENDQRTRFSCDDATLRSACLAVTLMAKMAQSDGEASAPEADVIRAVLRSDWSLTTSEANSLYQAAHNLERIDVFRLGESLRQRLPEEARLRLLAGLFQVARASEGIVDEEDADLRKMASCLGLSHRQMVAAKGRGGSQ